MNELDFLPSEALGVRADDARFMARFSANLALERRPPSVPRSRLFTWLEAGGIAILGALVLAVALPWGDALTTAVRTSLGWSTSTLMIVLGGASGLGILLWPRVDLEEIW